MSSLTPALKVAAIVLVGWTATGYQSASKSAEPSGIRILATVDGKAITSQDVEQRWQASDPASFAAIEAKRADIMEKVLDEMIAEELVAREARRLGVTSEELLKTEVPQRIQPVTDELILKEFGRLKATPNSVSLDVARPTIARYLTQRQPFEARRKYVAELRARSQGVVRIAKPFRLEVAVVSSDPVAGPPAAPVTLVLFSDFQCPYCRQLEPVLAQVQARFAGQVRLVWKDFPKPNHDQARGAARAARCAHDQGAFWPYRDQLFRGQDRLGLDDLIRYASDVGLSKSAFESCLSSDKHDGVVNANVLLGVKYGVSGTPTLFVNGRVVTGAVPFSVLEKVVIDELASIESRSGAGGR